jgi:1-acyl-sn-glycerol-3-phosphate acyltransferase/nucleoside-diphosphate-sugar epimerase
MVDKAEINTRNGFEMARVIVFDERESIAELVVKSLNESAAVEWCQRASQPEDGYGGHLSGDHASLLKEHNIDTVVYSPPQRGRHRMAPDLEDAEGVFQQCVHLGVRKFVLLSSAMIYGASPHNQGLIPESRMILRSDQQPIAREWIDLETLATAYLGELSGMGIELVILRPAAVVVPHGDDYFSRLFRSRLAVTLPGHDPTLQLLSPIDLALGVRCALEKDGAGVYNLAPNGVITLRAGLQLIKAKRLPISRLVQRPVRYVLAQLGLADPINQLEYIRYSWTISNKKSQCDLKWTPHRSSVEALRDFRIAETGYVRSDNVPSLEFDDFGMDRQYIAAFGRTLFKFLHDRYWRVEVKGLDHVPRSGRAVLVGVHRGFMPWDAVMALHLIVWNLRRYVRFLIHPGLIRFPFLFNFHTKLGGIIACQENAAYVLERDEMLGLFPEGIRGAFALYRDAYKLGRFGRDEYVKIALRHRAPIIPFVTVGSAEIFPILKKLDWAWWKRHTEWPGFPITPTFPFLPPVPLPAKWHTQFLEPIHIEERYPPEAAGNPETVRAISLEVRNSMEKAIGEMLRCRKSIFYGSIFGEQTDQRLSYEEPITYKERLS